jgi:hypothetical protein
MVQEKSLVWCSQDRPKKGLCILCWTLGKMVYKERQDIVLCHWTQAKKTARWKEYKVI